MHPDIELLLVAYLTEQTGLRTVTELPANLEAQLPVIQVARVPSPAGYRLDRPLVDISTWYPQGQRAECSQMARTIADLVVNDLPGPRRTHGVVTAATVQSAPYWLSDPNPKLCRYLATYQFAAHI
jgi:hypothetical protein